MIQYILLFTILILLVVAIFGIYKYSPKKTSTVTKKTNKQVGKPIILDSCSVIDGRVVELAKLGFLNNEVIVPEFILKELQLLADGRDSHKRERARFGLHVIQELQDAKGVDVTINHTDPDKDVVDDKLVALAKDLSADLYTTDYNLNQVASIDGVTVLNVNELAHALRPEILPGETVKISILQSGTNKDQGVGYLDDGTMVVVDGAIKDIGKIIEAKISKSHQTAAGKMLFAQKVQTNQPVPATKPEKKVSTIKARINKPNPQKRHYSKKPYNNNRRPAKKIGS